MFYKRHTHSHYIEEVANGINISSSFVYLNYKNPKLLTFPFIVGNSTFHIILTKTEEYFEVKKDLKGDVVHFLEKWGKTNLILFSIEYNRDMFMQKQNEDFREYLHPRRREEIIGDFFKEEIKRLKWRNVLGSFYIGYEKEENLIYFDFNADLKYFLLGNTVSHKTTEKSREIIEKSISLTKKYINKYKNNEEIDIFSAIREKRKERENKEQVYFIYLQERIKESERYKKIKSDIVDQRLKEELVTVKREGFGEYFYNFFHICNYLQRNNILYHLKGSGVGSLLLYVLGINTLNPLTYGISFSRFLGNGKIADIDIDVPSEKRKDILLQLQEYFKKEGKQLYHIMNKSSQNFSKVVVHPTGILIEPKDENILPLTYEPDITFPITDWYDSSSEPILEKTGYLKYDIISSVVLEEIQQKGVSVELLESWESIVWEKEYYSLLLDPQYNFFQLNAEPIRRILSQYEPKGYRDLVKLIAINRPAVLRCHPEKDIIEQLNRSDFTHKDKTIEEIVGESQTGSLLIYQDQAIKLLQYILPQVPFSEIINLVKGRSQNTQKYQKEFLQNYVTLTRDMKEAYYYWKQIQYFKKYGLNKAHSHSYGFITFIQLYTEKKK